MLTHIQRMIEELKKKIKHNIEVINANQEKIKKNLNDQGSDKQPQKFDEYNHQNKRLMAQNNDLINVHLTLLNFLDKYRETAILNENLPVIDLHSVTDEDEMVSLIVKGVVVFDSKHPYYRNSEFIDKLIEYYECIENYEKCQELVKLKEKTIS
jgi:hypothetical protein